MKERMKKQVQAAKLLVQYDTVLLLSLLSKGISFIIKIGVGASGLV